MIGTQAAIGRLAEGSDANPGLRASCPNFQPNNGDSKVRTDFHSLRCYEKGDHFYREMVQYGFPSVVESEPLGETMVAHLSEDSSRFSEHSV
jgi:hypothetical protein